MSAGSSSVDVNDWVQLGMLGNDIAMNWWILAHPGSQLPVAPASGQISVPGARVTFNPNLVIVGAVIVLAVLFMKK